MRKERSDKRIRVAPTLSKDHHNKLEMLALACGRMKKTHLAQKMLEMCLDHPDIINHMQDRYGSEMDKYLHITPVREGEKVIYSTGYDRL